VRIFANIIRTDSEAILRYRSGCYGASIADCQQLAVLLAPHSNPKDLQRWG